jgi:Txe/YoeB family toxin of toxin-antitoxin system
MGFRLIFSKQALKDAKRLEQAGLDWKAKELLKILRESPLQNSPPYEKLVGDLTGKYSRRINIHHRLVYKILEEENIVVVFRMWTHYK